MTKDLIVIGWPVVGGSTRSRDEGDKEEDEGEKKALHPYNCFSESVIFVIKFALGTLVIWVHKVPRRRRGFACSPSFQLLVVTGADISRLISGHPSLQYYIGSQP